MRAGAAALMLRLTRFPFLYFVLVGAFAAATGGLVGTTFGLHNLFIEDGSAAGYGPDYFRNSPSFLTQICISLAILFAWNAPGLLDATDGTLAERMRANLRIDFPAMLALNVLIGASVLVLQLSGIGAASARAAQIKYSLLGFAAGVATSMVLAVAALAGAYYAALRPIWVFLFVFAIVVAGAMLHGKLIPAVSLFLLLSLVALVYMAVKLLPEHLRLLAVLTIVALLVIGYGFSKRSEFDGVADQRGVSYYAHPVSLEKANAQADAEGLAPIAALAAWKQTLGDRPAKLVIVTTSGGAYRAAFWTAIVLDELVSRSAAEGPLAGFDRNIRLLTGASGGMVAAAYFVATARESGTRSRTTERLVEDIKAGQSVPAEFSTDYPIARDTLSQVAQQLIQRDLPSSVLPFMASSDRGRVLESSWRTLDATFANLLPGEAAGWRPSMILSPMIVETGAPLLISNLNLAEMSQGNTPYLTFFELFPGSRASFRLRTAVRMNATFPFVSPIVALPTVQPRRVVDAGYFENFGIATAVQFLRMPSVMEWIKENASGVAIVQIRSSRTEAPVSEHIRKPDCKGLSPIEGEPGPFGWLTGPIEAAASSREVSMLVRNQQALSMLKDLYGNDLVTSVVIENTARSSLSWYLPQTEFECLLEEAKSDYNAASFRMLEKWWTAVPPASR